MGCPVLFHPDYTVGSGITPDLLTLPHMPDGEVEQARQALAG